MYWKIIVSVVALCVFQHCRPQLHSDNKISIEEVYQIINDSAKMKAYVLLDTRGRMDYIRGHLVSAFWLSPDSVRDKIEILSKETRPIILYDAGDKINLKVVEAFIGNGITNFYIMEGGFSSWTEQGYPAAIQLVRNTGDVVNFKHTDISATEAYEFATRKGSSSVIIDTRPYPAFEEAHIKGARSIPYVPINEFVVQVEEHNFARDQTIIIYGEGDMVHKAIDVMLRNDFSKVYLLKGGIEAWYYKKYPIE